MIPASWDWPNEAARTHGLTLDIPQHSEIA